MKSFNWMIVSSKGNYVVTHLFETEDQREDTLRSLLKFAEEQGRLYPDTPPYVIQTFARRSESDGWVFG